MNSIITGLIVPFNITINWNWDFFYIKTNHNNSNLEIILFDGTDEPNRDEKWKWHTHTDVKEGVYVCLCSKVCLMFLRTSKCVCVKKILQILLTTILVVYIERGTSRMILPRLSLLFVFYNRSIVTQVIEWLVIEIIKLE